VEKAESAQIWYERQTYEQGTLISSVFLLALKKLSVKISIKQI
jgi:hypothetical protein